MEGIIAFILLLMTFFMMLYGSLWILMYLGIKLYDWFYRKK